MLTGKLSLHGIDDVEAFAAAIVNRSRLELNHHDREDLACYLVETAWELSLKYQRGDPKYPPRFSVYAAPILRNRVVDWQRKRFGRTRWVFHDRVHMRPGVELVSLDADDPDGTRFEKLSDRGQAILRLVAAPIWLGYSEREVARELGTTKRWVSYRLDELRAELEVPPGSARDAHSRHG